MQIIDKPKKRAYITVVDADRKRGRGGAKSVSKTVYGATPDQVMEILKRGLKETQADAK